MTKWTKSGASNQRGEKKAEEKEDMQTKEGDEVDGGAERQRRRMWWIL